VFLIYEWRRGPREAYKPSMSLLYLIRHAQASFLQEKYDKLSSLGEQQASLLAEHWAARRLKFDRVATGPCQRQKHTAQFVGRAYQASEQAFPELQELEEFDEYQAEAVLKLALPELLATDESIAKLQAAFQSSSTESEQRKHFQKLFESVIHRWVRAEIAPQDVESWQEFKTRVNRGLRKFLKQGQRGETAAIFTSGGPIAIAMQTSLHFSDASALGVSWMSRNCSWSEFLYGPERFTLSTFNSHPHLEDPQLLTYR
jgi:broad specificity phosphatase PhoE